MKRVQRLWPLLLAPTVLAFAPGQDQKQPLARYRGEKGWITIRNFDSIDSTSKDGTVIEGAGRPMTIEDTGNGLVLTGKGMRAVLKPGPKGMILESATVADGARVVSDTEVAYRTATEIANPAPPRPDEFTKTQIDSETIVFQREGNDGILTLPTAATMVMVTKGESVSTANGQTTRTPFTQNLEVKGSKGRFVVQMTEQGEVNAPRTGRIDGPVTFHLVRNETVADTSNPGGTKVNASDFKGSTDLVEAKLDGPEDRNLTATGNVQVTGQMNGQPLEVTGEKAVIVLDKSLKPTGYRFEGNRATGQPATTRIKLKTGGGR